MHQKAKEYIDKLQLQPHPEGGYFKEVYRSGEVIESGSLPKRYRRSRSFSTSIYFMLEGNNFSAFHKLKSDELWHFYDGCAVNIYIIAPDGALSTVTLGRELDNGNLLQAAITKESWFAAETADKESFALIGCTVAPGFDFDDFELAKQDELIQLFPEHKDLILKFTRE